MTNDQIYLRACRDGDIETVKKMMVYRNNKTVFDGLFDAIRDNQCEIVTYLIENGVQVDIVDKDSWTPLIIASFYGYNNLVKLLIDNNANLDLQDRIGSTALIIASKNGRTEIVNLLCENKASIDLQDKDGKSALMWASYYNNIKEAHSLIDNGASIELRNEDYMNSFDYAFLRENLDIAYLLDQDFMDKQDKNGNTKVMLACQNKIEKQLMFFYEKGANFYLKNNYGESAIDILIRHDDLSEQLHAFKEKILLEHSIDENTDDYGLSL